MTPEAEKEVMKNHVGFVVYVRQVYKTKTNFFL